MTTHNVSLCVFDDELLTRTSSGTVWGRIYFDLGDGAFPEKGWTDMMLAFTDAWLDSVLQIASGASNHLKVHFLDGPLIVSIASAETGLVRLEFLHKDLVKHEVRARIDELLKNGTSTADNALSICRTHGWTNDRDYLRLASTYSRAITSGVVGGTGSPHEP